MASPSRLALSVTLALASGLGACRSEDPARTPAARVEDDSPTPPLTPDASATPSPPDEPPLTREEVRLVVRAKMAHVRTCFAAGLARDPAIGGRVVLRFTIDAQGRTSTDEIEIVEDALGEAVATCLQEQLATWQFPLPRGGRTMSVSYPFVFSSERSLRAAGLPRVEGTVKPAAVGAVFAAHQDEADECLPELAKGMVGLAFTLDEHGSVTKISVYETTLAERSAACVARNVSSWRFPATAAGDEARVNHELWW